MPNSPFDLQQREVLLFPRADGRAANPRQEDRLISLQPCPAGRSRLSDGAVLSCPMVLAAAVWYHWFAWLLVLLAVGGTIATLVGYYVKVLSHKGHRR